MALAFIDYAQSFIMAKQHAELYERLFPFASEDFTNHKDDLKRQNNVNLYIQQLHTQLDIQKQFITTHIHTATGPIAPTTPPTGALTVRWPSSPVNYQNTSGVKTNYLNQVAPYQYLSYLDIRNTTNINKPFLIYRRTQALDINTPLITPSLTRI